MRCRGTRWADVQVAGVVQRGCTKGAEVVQSGAEMQWCRGSEWVYWFSRGGCADAEQVRRGAVVVQRWCRGGAGGVEVQTA
jgi:hypothetical protein